MQTGGNISLYKVILKQSIYTDLIYIHNFHKRYINSNWRVSHDQYVEQKIKCVTSWGWRVNNFHLIKILHLDKIFKKSISNYIRIIQNNPNILALKF